MLLFCTPGRVEVAKSRPLCVEFQMVPFEEHVGSRTLLRRVIKTALTTDFDQRFMTSKSERAQRVAVIRLATALAQVDPNYLFQVLSDALKRTLAVESRSA